MQCRSFKKLLNSGGRSAAANEKLCDAASEAEPLRTNLAQTEGVSDDLTDRYGASEGIRTLDTHVGNVMLYQAELRSLPNKLGQITRIF